MQNIVCGFENTLNMLPYSVNAYRSEKDLIIYNDNLFMDFHERNRNSDRNVTSFRNRTFFIAKLIDYAAIR